MRNHRGFTLIELLVAVGLLAVVVAGIYRVFGSQEKAYILQDKMAEMNQNARVALEFMSKEIRNAGYDPTWASTMVGAAAGIQTATATTIVFSQDTNGDGDVGDSSEFIGYRFDNANNQIDRCSGGGACGAWQPFMDEVQNLQFNYVMVDGTTTQTPANLLDIREVEIQVQAARTGQTDADAEVMSLFQNTTLSSRVKVRNLALR